MALFDGFTDTTGIGDAGNTTDDIDDMSSMSMSSMVFHFREKETILFAFWKTGSVQGLLVSCLITFLLCLLYEALRALRYFLARSMMFKAPATPADRKVVLKAARGAVATNGDTDSLGSTMVTMPVLRLGSMSRNFTKYRLSQALLYGCQVLIAYMLMLIVMTFNVWLLIAVVLGEMTGYFFFTGTPEICDATEDCCGWQKGRPVDYFFSKHEKLFFCCKCSSFYYHTLFLRLFVNVNKFFVNPSRMGFNKG